MAKIRQTDQLDETQFKEEEIGDEYADNQVEEEVGMEDEEGQARMGNALSSFKLSSGAIITTVVVLAIIIVAVVFFKPFSGEGGGEGFSIGKFFGREGSLGSDVLGEDNSTMSYADSLIQYLEGYTVKDNEDGTYTVTGVKDEKPHIMVYDGSFNIITETVGETTTSYTIDEETGERVPTTALTASNTIVPEQKAEIVEGDEMVKVDKWSYEHSQLGMKATNLAIEYDENGVAITRSYDDKFIVQYTKLPLRGSTAQVYVKFMEADTELIFNISVSAYLALEETGASMISARVTEIGGQKLFHNIQFSQWK